MVDDSFCTVGSTNVNARSFRFDYEVNAFVMDRCVTRQLQQIFDADLKDATLLTPQNWKKRHNVWHRFQGWLFQFLVPFL